MVEIATQLRPYVSLLESFIHTDIDAPAFEHAYLALYKNDQTPWSPEAFDVLDGLFAEVDDYTPYPELRDLGDPTDEDLRVQAARRLDRLLVLGDRVVRE